MGEDCILIYNNILEVNDETLPMFTELARLMRKISDKDEKEFVVDKSYLYSKLFNTSIFMDNEIDNYSAAKMHNAFKVKKGAKAINKLIQRIMERYFAE